MKWKAALLALALCSGTASYAGERIAIPAIGFEMEAPNGWIRRSADEDTASLNSLDIGSAEFRAAIAGRTLPILILSGPGSPFRVTPTIKILLLPRAPGAGLTGAQLVDRMVEFSSRGLPDFRLLGPPRAESISGRPATHASFAYSVPFGDEDVATVSEVWIVPRGDYLLSIGIGYGAGESVAARAAILAAVRSIVIAAGD